MKLVTHHQTPMAMVYQIIVDLDDDNDGIYDLDETCQSAFDDNNDGVFNSLDSLY